ncbi:MAG: hypothetical protein FGM57_03875 [Candidatus Taylorbacteria bacterium]|nr:hypothetical protein [Candidatus Taylorbacteria bacterium]
MELILHEKGMIWIIAIILHLLFVMVGMGSAIISDILFSFFSKDKKIDTKEDSVLVVLSNTIWVSLIGMLVTGFLLFLHNPERYGSSPDFLSKMSMVIILILNGIIFALYIHPNLRNISFTDTNNTHRLVRVRRISFACGALSITTWLSIFTLALIDKITLTYTEIMATYGVVVISAMLLSQVIDRLQAKR